MAIKTSLKEIRRKNHMSQADLALASGSCSRTISRIESGERNPSLEMALRISQSLGRPVEDIFQLDEL